MEWKLLILFMFFINEITIGVTGYYISKAILTLKQPIVEQNIEPVKRKERKHVKIQSPNYTNSFNNRSYDIYKNEKTGLYEPQKPHQGIELKTQKED
jgi:hypothetical protein